MEVAYRNYGEVTIAKINGDGTYDLATSQGTETVARSELEYLLFFIDLQVTNLKWTTLVADPEALEQFKMAIQERLALWIGLFSAGDVFPQVYRSSVRDGNQWCGAVFVRAMITPPPGSTAGGIYVAWAKAETQALFDSTIIGGMPPRIRELATDPGKQMVATLLTGGTTTNKKTLHQPELYPSSPEFYCWYKNEDDPRIIACGNDSCQCRQPTPAPNVATLTGKILFALIMPWFFLVAPFRALV
eukprot:TRINITY_DN31566_c0_g1_i1.p1 TRINITY_DN31566_c0_g1~~TRINITY_DN31566_c0_g1_i1.p1  ORF type:complete len:283 (-),score=23.15 TRINITY_DN31566_c0_g1_i1:512-1246(-)